MATGDAMEQKMAETSERLRARMAEGVQGMRGRQEEEIVMGENFPVEVTFDGNLEHRDASFAGAVDHARRMVGGWHRESATVFDGRDGAVRRIYRNPWDPTGPVIEED